ncbi:tetratricopeptide repeat protein [Eisenibacter elegans]|uniref:tetratricopeptide repeat protein n=1 Tax=Eisenibacter elegans TaxID=997 RepID=UPI0003F5EF47|nr:tetratricopeptide repeat protein [Eisenibacter elegans]
MSNISTTLPDEQAKISALLQSRQDGDILLALQLLQNNAAAGHFLTELWALSLLFPSKKIRQVAYRVFRQAGNVALLAWAQARRQGIQRPLPKPTSEAQAYHMITKWSNNASLDRAVFARMCLQITGGGGSYCLIHRVLSAEKVLTHLLNTHPQHLSLAYFGLYELPKEVGLFPELVSLDLRGNHFTEIPDEITLLSKLRYLYYDDTPLSITALRKLRESFPALFAGKHYMAALELFRQKSYGKAFREIDRCLRIDSDIRPEAYRIKGMMYQALKHYHQADECFAWGIGLAPQNLGLRISQALNLEESHWYSDLWDVCVQALIHLDTLQERTQERLFFQRLQAKALCGLGRYQEAQQLCEQLLGENNRQPDTWFLLAETLYQHNAQDKRVLICLQQAINLNPSYYETLRKHPTLKRLRKSFLPKS